MDSDIDIKPMITVLMPVYNCELYVKEAIDSILNQTFRNFEFIIIDDASTDNTIAIIKKYIDSRIQLIEKPLNTGYTNSLNLGLKLAKGKYIARMDGDDVCLPERFEKQVSFLEINPNAVLCGAWLKIIGTNKVVKLPETHDAIKLALIKGNCIVHPTVMLRKEVLDQFSIVYEQSKEPAEDYDLWVRLLLLGELHNLQEVLLNYRTHTTQVSNKRAKEQSESALQTRLDLLNYLECKLTPQENSLLKKIIGNEGEVSFKDIVMFQSLIKRMIESNNVNFFEPHGFKMYLFSIENKIVNKYFFKRDTYSIFNFIQYLKIKFKLGIKMSIKKELKLLTKSMISYKSKERI